MMKNNKKKPDEEVIEQDEEQVVVEKQEEVDPCEDLKKQLEDAQYQVKRTLADYQNLEKRVREEKQGWIRIANKELLLRLLPVLDTLMLAGKHSNDQSLKISINQFLDILKSEGVVAIEMKGKDFDAHTMEAVEIVEAGDKEDGKVIGEIRTGFMIHDILLRPAQVRVGKKSD